MKKMSFLSLVCGALLACVTATPASAESWNESESAGNTGNSRSGEVRRGEIKATKPAGMSERAVQGFAKNWRGNIPVDREEDDNGETRSDETNATEPASASGRVDQDWGGRRNWRGYDD